MKLSRKQNWTCRLEGKGYPTSLAIQKISVPNEPLMLYGFFG